MGNGAAKWGTLAKFPRNPKRTENIYSYQN